MAFQDSTTKSIGIILGVGLLAVVFIAITALTANRQEKVDYTVFQEELSKLIFNAPLNWTVGKSESSKVQTTSQFISTIRSQSSQCSVTSPQVSGDLRSAMQQSRADAVAAWQKQYPGIVEAELYNSSGGFRALAGVDICEPVLVRKTMYIRGVVFSDSIEIQFTMRYPQDSSLTQSQMRELANSVVRGQADQASNDWEQFKVLLGSIEKP